VTLPGRAVAYLALSTRSSSVDWREMSPAHSHWGTGAGGTAAEAVVCARVAAGFFFPRVSAGLAGVRAAFDLVADVSDVSLVDFVFSGFFAAAGFRDVTLVPDVDAVAARYPKFFVGAVVARR